MNEEPKPLFAPDKIIMAIIAWFCICSIIGIK